MTTRMLPLSLLVTAFIAGCAKHKTNEVHDQASSTKGHSTDRCHRIKPWYVEESLTRQPNPCNGCGSNSPIANEFPINGLTSKDCNPEAVRLVPGSLSGGGCGSGDTLSLSNDKTRLVGSTCEGAALKHSRFKVEGPMGTQDFEISDWKEVPADIGSAMFEEYQIDAVGGTGSDHNACHPDVSESIRESLGLKRRATDHDYVIKALPIPPAQAAAPDGDWVIAVPGPIYTQKLDVFIGTSDMFQLACIGDGIAKRSLDNLFKTGSDSKTQDSNTAALRLLTATYCDKPYTAHGIEIAFGSAGQPPPTPEAAWSASGALCLAQPRLLELFVGQINLAPKEFPPALQPAGCLDHTYDCSTSAKWVEAIRAECAKSDAAKSNPALRDLPVCPNLPTLGGSDEWHSCVFPNNYPSPTRAILALTGSGSGDFCAP